jgi:peptide/nickel transport system ATP-binding protein
LSIRLEMLALLDDLRQRLHLALLYITHDIASARYFADEVIVLYAGQVMERGPAEGLTQHPAHPYTQLLVASAPDPDRFGSSLHDGARPAGAATAGAATNGSLGRGAAAAATGCPFTVRCPFAEDRCRAQMPPLQLITPSRAAACWRLDVAAPDVLAGQQGGGNITD